MHTMLNDHLVPSRIKMIEHILAREISKSLYRLSTRISHAYLNTNERPKLSLDTGRAGVIFKISPAILHELETLFQISIQLMHRLYNCHLYMYMSCYLNSERHTHIKA